MKNAIREALRSTARQTMAIVRLPVDCLNFARAALPSGDGFGMTFPDAAYKSDGECGIGRVGTPFGIGETSYHRGLRRGKAAAA